MAAPALHIQALTGFGLMPEAPMREHTSFRVGGPARFLAFPQTVSDLICLIQASREDGLPVHILGGGTNTLVTDQGIQGLVICLTRLKEQPEVLDQTGIRIMAGQSLAGLCRFAMENHLSGLEWAAGIPGTLGGALKMNAGSFGSDMAAVTQTLKVLDLVTLEPRTLAAQELVFTYRNLDLEQSIILGATLELTQGNREKILALHRKNLETKQRTQPVSQASAGCFFKNPSPDKPAGWLIEQAGLKGYIHKGARISDLHANFIINHNNATCAQILELAQMVKDKVFSQFNINLETEVKAIGS